MGRPGCGWGTSAGPSNSGTIQMNLRALDFGPKETYLNDHPAIHTTYIDPGGANWFLPAIRFPQNSGRGGSWVHCPFVTEAWTDPAVNPSFRIWWTADAVGTAGFDMHYVCTADGNAPAAPGPGTTASDTIAAVGDIQAGPIVQMAPAAGAWGANRFVNVNIYRGNAQDTIAGYVYLLAVSVWYEGV